MKAIVFDAYCGPDGLELRELDPPTPAGDQVLVRVRAASVNPVDWHRMRGEPYLMRPGEGLSRPKRNRLGADVAGIVEAVGAGVTHVRPRDEVYGMGLGTLSELVAVAGEGIVPKPASLSFEQAAAVPVAAMTALQGLRDRGGIQAGQTVLVNGASGGVGTFAVQIAKSFGAEVTGVTSTSNAELVRSLGADHVVDYTRGDFTRSGELYDLAFDAVGNRSLTAFRRILAPDGTLVLCGAAKGRSGGRPLLRVVRALLMRRFVSQKVETFLAQRNRDDLLFLKELLESGKVTPVIERSYPLSETAAAIRHLETGRARGKIVVAV